MVITLSVSGQHHRAEVSELKSTPEGYVTYNKGHVSHQSANKHCHSAPPPVPTVTSKAQNPKL